MRTRKVVLDDLYLFKGHISDKTDLRGKGLGYLTAIACWASVIDRVILAHDCLNTNTETARVKYQMSFNLGLMTGT